MWISFIRHGRLNSTIEPMTITSFHEWLKRYDVDSMSRECNIPIETIEAVESANLIVSSDQRRAVQSAAELMNSLSFVQNSLFREVEVPSSFLHQNGLNVSRGLGFLLDVLYGWLGIIKMLSRIRKQGEGQKKLLTCYITMQWCTGKSR